jgi:hypothetical protein
VAVTDNLTPAGKDKLVNKLGSVTNNLNVVTSELTDRAAELQKMVEYLTKSLPSEGGDPLPPNDLNSTGAAILTLKNSAKNIRLYMGSGFREWEKLAESLGNVAKTYNAVDEKANEALSKIMASGDGGQA